ncbi:HNH endonuclease [Bacillus phage vB_BanS_Skywalker]|uniref:HNH endonuclease n=1 Tax=Bacillus phage vB_BanS_Skywalker TaxID=2894789 RepID=A0AAE9CE33_9CAUD|nr:HNH endonuclease [Bacillus phage vB_BanS_Skywalker]UGO51375.1 HNH endonuclease [Bacillus phage vB_BanS_Skywalker]
MMLMSYMRKETYGIEEVLSKVLPKDTPKESRKVYFDGDMISMISDRYHIFKEKGIACVSCGIKGEFFAKERDKGCETYHFNLYAVDDGEEVLMTKDHIVPKSKGGANHINNYQTMCYTCNQLKSDK